MPAPLLIDSISNLLCHHRRIRLLSGIDRQETIVSLILIYHKVYHLSIKLSHLYIRLGVTHVYACGSLRVCRLYILISEISYCPILLRIGERKRNRVESDII